jgi:hypothetical protein
MRTGKWKIVISVIVVLITSGFHFAWQQYHRKHADTTDLTATVKKEAMSLIKEFESDETAASLKYNGKVVSVKGAVLKIEYNNDTRNLILGDGSSATGVICELQPEHKRDADKIIPGQQVSIKGICTGMLLDVVMVRCVLEQN